MANELDMEAYHSEGIDPGEHKVFNISPSVHTFNERFQGYSQPFVNPGDTFLQRFEGEPGQFTSRISGESFKGTPSLDRPSLQAPPPWPEEGFMHVPFIPGESMPETPEESRKSQQYGGFTPISYKGKGPFDIPAEGGAGSARIGATTTGEPLFKSEEIGTPQQVAAQTRYKRALERLQKEAPDIYKDMQDYLESQKENISSAANKIKRELRSSKGELKSPK